MIDIMQIGANAGYTPEGEDVIWPIIRDKGWRGLFVEPLPEPFGRLVENYMDMDGHIFENVAIMDYEGNVNIHYSEGDSRVASVSNSHMTAYNQHMMEVPCTTIERLLQKHNMWDVPFELLQIDTEGYDGRILKGTDFTHVLPRYIRFEHVHLGKYDPTRREHVIDHLSPFGYRVVDDIFQGNGCPGEDNIDTVMERLK